jgi:hypothetical protein
MSKWTGLKWLMIGKIAEFCRRFVEICLSDRKANFPFLLSEFGYVGQTAKCRLRVSIAT